MSFINRQRSIVLTALLLVILATIWIVFAPMQLGGPAAYIMITGNSMEPKFHTGDLVIVFRQTSYHVGEMVAYRNAELGRPVFHRIVETRGEHFVFKGDNNSWLDSYQPVQNELLGAYWTQLPSAAKWIQWIRIPLHMGITLGIIGGVLMAGFFFNRSEDHESMNKKTIGDWFYSLRQQGLRQWLAALTGKGPASRTITLSNDASQGSYGTGQTRGPKYQGRATEILFFVLSLIAFTSLIIAGFAFSRPVQRLGTETTSYQNIGTFFYSAPAPSGVYDSQSIQSGDPLFPKLTCTVNMGFSYALAGIDPTDLSGSYQLVAKVMDQQSGWQRIIPLTTKNSFSGKTFTTSAPLDLCQIEELVATVEAETDLHVPYYALVITPNVTIHGSAVGQELNDTFQPSLTFQFDAVHFFVVNRTSESNPLNQSETRLLSNSHMEANTLPFLGMTPAVVTLRILSLLGLAVSLGGLALLGITVSSIARQSPENLVEVKYSPLLVNVREKSLEAPTQTIDVDSIDDLARLAERHNTMILHQKKNRIHFYTVRGEHFSYRYTINDSGDALSSVPLVQLEDDLQRGLERGEFEVYYQPIMSLEDGGIFGVEALLRWRHPQLGMVPAAEFIPAAEATGLIDTLGDWLLRVACVQLKTWRENGLPLILSVNFSEYQLEGDPTASIQRVLQNTGLDPKVLQVEIPAIKSIDGSQELLQKLQTLKALGIQISIEDPTGQSVLSLPHFPATSIKIDRPSVQRINEQDKADDIHNMIETARSLGLNVIAEGVETQEQLEFLQSQYCNFAQGYLLGRPVSAEEITRTFLKKTDSDPEKHRRRNQ